MTCERRICERVEKDEYGLKYDRVSENCNLLNIATQSRSLPATTVNVQMQQTATAKHSATNAAPGHIYRHRLRDRDEMHPDETGDSAAPRDAEKRRPKVAYIIHSLGVSWQHFHV